MLFIHFITVFIAEDPTKLDSVNKKECSKIKEKEFEETIKTLEDIGSWLNNGDRIAVYSYYFHYTQKLYLWLNSLNFYQLQQ